MMSDRSETELSMPRPARNARLRRARPRSGPSGTQEGRKPGFSWETEAERAPPRFDAEWLAAWSVPEPAPDLAERVLDHVDTVMTMMPEADATTPIPHGPSSALPDRRGLGLAVTLVAMVAAAALVLALGPWWRGSSGVESPAAVVVGPTADPGSAGGPAGGPSGDPPEADGAPLVVRTIPRDAQVWIDGKPVAGPSPFSVSRLAHGSHRLTVERDGYLPVERMIEGGSAVEIPIELSLREVVLVLSVDPPEATVTLRTHGAHEDERIELGSDGDRTVLRRELGVRYEVEAHAPGYVTRRVPLSWGGRGASRRSSVAVAGPRPGGSASACSRSTLATVVLASKPGSQGSLWQAPGQARVVDRRSVRGMGRIRRLVVYGLVVHGPGYPGPGRPLRERLALEHEGQVRDATHRCRRRPRPRPDRRRPQVRRRHTDHEDRAAAGSARGHRELARRHPGAHACAPEVGADRDPEVQVSSGRAHARGCQARVGLRIMIGLRDHACFASCFWPDLCFRPSGGAPLRVLVGSGLQPCAPAWPRSRPIGPSTGPPWRRSSTS